ncbi:metallo-beta-lactamase family protein [Listeria floridensis FSL S10-1187]|uniref:Metallo-beta-lactamase family protein n=1 Tax=Listeria floridensis FSL S10-1187 TaxID=1265817 RepID=A0ABN0RES9_9LIST|nr:hypothetical protein [Listeria floridensis]EUJ31390.1 metallo-beta-lactamase family protein [Listeria floridensis FSL S10-1187]
MTASKYDFIGKQYLFDFGAEARYQLDFKSETELVVTVVADSFYPSGTVNHFEIQVALLRDNLVMLTWVEPATGNTVTHVDDFVNNVAYTNITDLASKQFWRLSGTITRLDRMSK